jgi:hypothetical protein
MLRLKSLGGKMKGKRKILVALVAFLAAGASTGLSAKAAQLLEVNLSDQTWWGVEHNTPGGDKVHIQYAPKGTLSWVDGTVQGEIIGAPDTTQWGPSGFLKLGNFQFMSTTYDLAMQYFATVNGYLTLKLGTIQYWGGGDGFNLKILKGEQQIYPSTGTYVITQEWTTVPDINLGYFANGEQIHVIINAGATNNGDNTSWQPKFVTYDTDPDAPIVPDHLTTDTKLLDQTWYGASNDQPGGNMVHIQYAATGSTDWVDGTVQETSSNKFIGAPDANEWGPSGFAKEGNVQFMSTGYILAAEYLVRANGTLKISFVGNLNKWGSGGDGVNIKVLKNDDKVWPTAASENINGNASHEDIVLGEVTKGQFVRLVVDPGASNSGDNLSWEPHFILEHDDELDLSVSFDPIIPPEPRDGIIKKLSDDFGVDHPYNDYFHYQFASLEDVNFQDLPAKKNNNGIVNGWSTNPNPSGEGGYTHISAGSLNTNDADKDLAIKYLVRANGTLTLSAATYNYWGGGDGQKIRIFHNNNVIYPDVGDWKTITTATDLPEIDFGTVALGDVVVIQINKNLLPYSDNTTYDPEFVLLNESEPDLTLPYASFFTAFSLPPQSVKNYEFVGGFKMGGEQDTTTPGFKYQYAYLNRQRYFNMETYISGAWKWTSEETGNVAITASGIYPDVLEDAALTLLVPWYADNLVLGHNPIRTLSEAKSQPDAPNYDPDFYFWGTGGTKDGVRIQVLINNQKVWPATSEWHTIPAGTRYAKFSDVFGADSLDLGPVWGGEKVRIRVNAGEAQDTTNDEFHFNPLFVLNRTTPGLLSDDSNAPIYPNDRGSLSDDDGLDGSVESAIRVDRDEVKTIYYVGESFDPTGLLVYAVYDDGEEVLLESNKYTVNSSAYNKNAKGTYKIVVSYLTTDGRTLTGEFNVNVIENTGGDDPVTSTDTNSTDPTSTGSSSTTSGGCKKGDNGGATGLIVVTTLLALGFFVRKKEI